jgi:hypothetical protein
MDCNLDQQIIIDNNELYIFRFIYSRSEIIDLEKNK